MKIIYVFIGICALILGIIGIFLPILPTTPFLLLAATCFAKGSRRVNNYFVKSRIYNKYLKEFLENKTMSKTRKRNVLIFASTMMIISFFRISFIPLRIGLILLVIYMFYYFKKYIKTIDNENS